MNDAQKKQFWDLANAYAGATLDTKDRAAALLAFVESVEKPVAIDVSTVMGGYLRCCRSGGMTKARSTLIQDAVNEAQHLGYFAVAAAQAAT